MNYTNPWENVKGFKDLGDYDDNGVLYDLYCFPCPDMKSLNIGARYSNEGHDYISGSIYGIDSADTDVLCSSCEPMKEALSRIISKGILSLVKVEYYPYPEQSMNFTRKSYFAKYGDISKDEMLAGWKKKNKQNVTRKYYSVKSCELLK